MQNLEAACKEEHDLMDRVKLVGPGSSQPVAGPSWVTHFLSEQQAEAPRKSTDLNIHQCLQELYLKECKKALPSASLPEMNSKRVSRLLEKLVEKNGLNKLILNLYNDNKNYSQSSKPQGKLPAVFGCKAGRSQVLQPVIEVRRWPYCSEELLWCIDREEMPATLVDFLKTNNSQLFYQGCVIAEVRDFRPTISLSGLKTYHVILKPAIQSIQTDVYMINSSSDLSEEDPLALESPIVLTTAWSPELDPSPAVGNLHHKQHRLSTAPLIRTPSKFSQVNTVNRKRKLDQFTTPSCLQLNDCFTPRNAKQRASNQGIQTKKTPDEVLPTPPPVPKEESPTMNPPCEEPDELQRTEVYEKPQETTDCTAILVEAYILQTKREQGQIDLTSVSIFQRSSDSKYLGQLYMDRNYKEGEGNGASCQSLLGTRAQANRYIQQEKMHFMKNSLNPVRIIHMIPGQGLSVSIMPGMRERERNA